MGSTYATDPFAIFMHTSHSHQATFVLILSYNIIKAMNYVKNWKQEKSISKEKNIQKEKNYFIIGNDYGSCFFILNSSDTALLATNLCIYITI